MGDEEGVNAVVLSRIKRNGVLSMGLEKEEKAWLLELARDSIIFLDKGGGFIMKFRGKEKAT